MNIYNNIVFHTSIISFWSIKRRSHFRWIVPVEAEVHRCAGPVRLCPLHRLSPSKSTLIKMKRKHNNSRHRGHRNGRNPNVKKRSIHMDEIKRKMESDSYNLNLVHPLYCLNERQTRQIKENSILVKKFCRTKLAGMANGLTTFDEIKYIGKNMHRHWNEEQNRKPVDVRKIKNQFSGPPHKNKLH